MLEDEGIQLQVELVLRMAADGGGEKRHALYCLQSSFIFVAWRAVISIKDICVHQGSQGGMAS